MRFQIWVKKSNAFLLFPASNPPFFLLNVNGVTSVKNSLSFFNSPGWKFSLLRKTGFLLYFTRFVPFFKSEKLQLPHLFELVVNFLTDSYACKFIGAYIHSPDRIVIKCTKGKEIFFVKASSSEIKRDLLKKEYEALNLLAKVKPDFLFPEAVDFIKVNDADLLITKSLNGLKPIKPELNRKIVDLSYSIFSSSSKGLIHGDFKPWNIFWHKKNKKFYVIDWEDSFEEHFPLYDLFNFSLLTTASLKIGIKGKDIYKKFKSDKPHYRLFLKKAGLKNDDNEVIYWLKVYLEKIISREQFWNRWGEGEKRPLIIRNSFKELLRIIEKCK